MTHAVNEAPPAPRERRLPFEGISNFRDLGGYPTRHGAITRWATVYRSSSLHSATAEDRRRLAELGIGPVFDLRSHRELERDGHYDLAEIGCERQHTPVFDDIDASPEQLAARWRVYSEDFSTAYMSMLREGARSYRRVVEAIAASDRAVVFHCAAGKDRTGVLAAVLLGLAGVENETIVADYALTAEYLPRPAAGRIREVAETYGLTEAELLALHGSAPEAMARTLELFEALYGDAESYLRGIGVRPQDIDRAQARLLAA
jgi:protein-tyrosine phosphatase